MDFVDLSVAECAAGGPSAHGLGECGETVCALLADVEECGVGVCEHSGDLVLGSVHKVGPPDCGDDDSLGASAGALGDFGLGSAVGGHDLVGVGDVEVDELLVALECKCQNILSALVAVAEAVGHDAGTAHDRLYGGGCGGELAGELVGDRFLHSGGDEFESCGNDYSEGALGTRYELVEIVSGHVCPDVVVSGLDDGPVEENELHVEDDVLGGAVLVGSDTDGVGGKPLPDGLAGLEGV